MLTDPTFWVLVAFTLFIVALAKPAYGIITHGLDQRADKIRADIEEAEALLKEAQDLLATYEKKQRDATKEVDEITAQAKAGAERMAEHGHERLEAVLARREKLAQDRIQQAETAMATAESLMADFQKRLEKPATVPTKSGPPGVSIKLICVPWYSNEAIDASNECWCFCSSTSKSLTVVPLSTWPNEWIAPAFSSSASAREVFPAPAWPTRATFLMSVVV